MMVDEMTERWVHKDDVEILRAIYANEMTLKELLEDYEEINSEIENEYDNIKETIYELGMYSKRMHGLIWSIPLRYSDIKKD